MREVGGCGVVLRRMFGRSGRGEGIAVAIPLAMGPRAKEVKGVVRALLLTILIVSVCCC